MVSKLLFPKFLSAFMQLFFEIPTQNFHQANLRTGTINLLTTGMAHFWTTFWTTVGFSTDKKRYTF